MYLSSKAYLTFSKVNIKISSQFILRMSTRMVQTKIHRLVIYSYITIIIIIIIIIITITIIKNQLN